MRDTQEAPVKSPQQLIALVIASFLVPVAIIMLLVYYVDNAHRTGAGTDALSEQAVAKRVAPVAHVEIRDANAPRVYKSGEDVFKAVCSACHTAGVAGAPKLGDANAWAPRIAQGYDALLNTALHGKGGMPPRGGTNPDDYSDYEIARAVVYMANAAGGKFSEPAPPAAAAAARSAPAATGATAADAATATSAATPASPTTATAAPSAPIAIPPAPAPATSASGPEASTASGATTQTASADKAQAGKALYEQVCQACHAAGVAGAPKFGDKNAWAPRLKEPMDVIYSYALKGKGAMPPKGGSSASDAEVKAAVDYMVGAVK
jgi:cytochrome c5